MYRILQFYNKSKLNDLKDIGQGQSSLHMTHPPMVVIICVKYGKIPSRTVSCGEIMSRCFSSFTAKSWLNDLGDIGQGQKSLGTTHPLMAVMTWAKYERFHPGQVDSNIPCYDKVHHDYLHEVVITCLQIHIDGLVQDCSIYLQCVSNGDTASLH